MFYLVPGSGSKNLMIFNHINNTDTRAHFVSVVKEYLKDPIYTDTWPIEIIQKHSIFCANTYDEIIQHVTFLEL